MSRTPRRSLRSRRPPATRRRVNLATLLTDVETMLRRHVVLSDDQAVAITLWTAHTHAIEAADCTPYLQITSVTKRTGKTRLLEVLEPLVRRPWRTDRVSAAVLVRKIDAESPTLLLDESDAALKVKSDYSETLRGLLNSGYRRGGKASVCIGQGAELSYKDFSTFAPKAIAGIGRLPDTVADRSIPIKLRRRMTSELVQRWRERDGRAETAPIAKALAQWSPGVIRSLRAARPTLPDALDDRAQDVWEPLLAIARLAGGDWPARACKAALALSGPGHAEDEPGNVRVLMDVRAVFDQRSQSYLSSEEIIEGLADLPDSPWSHRSMRPARLASLLRDFGAGPGGLRTRKTRLDSTRTANRWHREDFEDPWARYGPADPEQAEQTNKSGPE